METPNEVPKSEIHALAGQMLKVHFDIDATKLTPLELWNLQQTIGVYLQTREVA